MKWTNRKTGEGLFTRKNGFKLKEPRFRLGIRKKPFRVSQVRYCNRLPRESVDAPSLAVSKARGFGKHGVAEGVPACGSGVETRQSLRCPPTQII